MFYCLLAVLLLNLASPPMGFGYAALIAFVPLFGLFPRKARSRFFLGWLSGFLTQAIGYYWIFFTIRDFGGQSPAISLVGGFLFWLYQGLDLALWLWLAPLVAARFEKWVEPFVAAALWMLIQVDLFPYVFPWSLGAPMADAYGLSSGAVIWGEAGLVFLNVTIAGFVFAAWKQKGARVPMAAVALFFLAAIAAGNFVPAPRSQKSLKIGMIQPNLIPWAKQGAASPKDLLEAHYEPSRVFIQQKVDLLVWPETALSFPLDAYPALASEVRALSRLIDAPIVTGALDVDQERYLYNQILVIDGRGIQASYAKEKLVWFSESLPWIFSWAAYFDPGMGFFRPGTDNETLVYKDLQMVPLVCYEALFAGYSRKRSGQIMVNLTNDAWFGQTKASSQHLQHIRLRAVEQRIPLLRATNSGISCWVDIEGQIQGATGLYTAASPVYEVPIPDEVPVQWHRYGEFGLRGVAVLLLLWALIRRRPLRGSSLVSSSGNGDRVPFVG